MKNKSFEQKFVSATIAFLMVFSTVSASIMTGCGSEESNSSKTSIVSGTIENSTASDTDSSNDPTQEQVETKVAESSSIANSGSSSESKAPSGNSNASSSSKASSGSQSSSSSSTSSNSSSSKKPSGKTLTLDNKKYSVGDTVTYTYALTCPEVLVNYQGVVKYDSNYLQVESAKLIKPATYSGMINKNIAGEVIFLGSEISNGYDYTKTGDLLTITFKIIGGGETSTNLEWQVATGFDEKKNTAYAKDNKPANGAKIDVKITV